MNDEGVTLHLELSGKRPINFFRFAGIKAEQTFTHFEVVSSVEHAIDRLRNLLAGETVPGSAPI